MGDDLFSPDNLFSQKPESNEVVKKSSEEQSVKLKKDDKPADNSYAKATQENLFDSSKMFGDNLLKSQIEIPSETDNFKHPGNLFAASDANKSIIDNKLNKNKDDQDSDNIRHSKSLFSDDSSPLFEEYIDKSKHSEPLHVQNEKLGEKVEKRKTLPKDNAKSSLFLDGDSKKIGTDKTKKTESENKDTSQVLPRVSDPLNLLINEDELFSSTKGDDHDLFAEMSKSKTDISAHDEKGLSRNISKKDSDLLFDDNQKEKVPSLTTDPSNIRYVKFNLIQNLKWRIKDDGRKLLI